MESNGIAVGELEAFYREEYLHAVEAVRIRHDPCADWDRFVEGLWSALVPAFGLDVTVLEEDEHRRGLRLPERSRPRGGGSSGEVE